MLNTLLIDEKFLSLSVDLDSALQHASEMVLESDDLQELKQAIVQLCLAATAFSTPVLSIASEAANSDRAAASPSE